MAFNGVGHFTIAANATIVSDGWRFGNGEDHGAQYFSANPLTNGGELFMHQESKGRDSNGLIFYGFTVTNRSNFAVDFDVQGGGFA